MEREYHCESAWRVIRQRGEGCSKNLVPVPSKLVGKTESTSKPAASTSKVERDKPVTATLGREKGGCEILAPPPSKLAGKTESRSKPAASASKVERDKPVTALLGRVKGGCEILAPPPSKL